MMMMRALAILFVLPTQAISSICPDSPVSVHATCSMTVSFDQQCQNVKTEVQARVADSSNWVDPHNSGTYSLDGTSDTRLELSRMTGDGLYTDKMALEFEKTDTGCVVSACSTSQVTSVLDASTNFCNLYNLYCNSEDGCLVVNEDLTHHEHYDSCWQRKIAKCNTMNMDQTRK